MSSSVTYFAWGLAGAFFTLVALPLACSSPYPTPNLPNWSIAPSQVTSASTFALASASSIPVPSQPSQSVQLVTTVRTLSIRRPIGDAPEEPEADREIVTASLGGHPTRETAYAPRANTSSIEDGAATLQERGTATTREIDDYLWEVYQRQPAKRDRGGDFSWKDPAAAKRMGKTMQAYVVLGMDADFREIIYHAGKAMDAAGIEWTIVSGFRDDWRQSIASGIKARTGFSRHGGSVAVGGYGHGRAIDIGHVDRDRNDEVWRWIDNNGAKYGMHRPHRSFDPPHVEPRVEWRRLASNLRRERTGATAVAEAELPSTVDDVRQARRKKVRVAHASAGRPSRNRRRN